MHLLASIWAPICTLLLKLFDLRPWFLVWWLPMIMARFGLKVKDYGSRSNTENCVCITLLLFALLWDQGPIMVKVDFKCQLKSSGRYYELGMKSAAKCYFPQRGSKASPLPVWWICQCVCNHKPCADNFAGANFNFGWNCQLQFS